MYSAGRKHRLSPDFFLASPPQLRLRASHVRCVARICAGVLSEFLESSCKYVLQANCLVKGGCFVRSRCSLEELKTGRCRGASAANGGAAQKDRRSM